MKPAIALGLLLLASTAAGVSAQRRPPTVAGSIQTGPAVTGATPTYVTLQIGGTAQVVLTGSRLGDITSAWAEHNGNRVGGIRVELLPVSDPAKRELRLSATSTTGIPLGVPLELVIQPRLSKTTIRTPVRITAEAAPNVDLLISDCTFQVSGIGSNRRVEARATLRNSGSGSISFQSGQIVATATPHITQSSPAGMTSFPVYRIVAPGGGHYIGPGGTLKVFATIWGGATAFDVTWNADPDDVIRESNPANNQRGCEYTPPPPPPPPDAAITGITVQPYSGPPDTKFTFTVTIALSYRTRLPLSTKIRARCLIDNVSFPGGNLYEPITTAFGSTNTYTWTIHTTGGYAHGGHTLECAVDPEREVEPADAIRTNNYRSLVFVVTK